MDPMIEIAYLGAMLMLGSLAFKMMSQGWGAMSKNKSDSYGSVMKAYGNKTHPETVSYTHLTLPTSDLV